MLKIQLPFLTICAISMTICEEVCEEVELEIERCKICYTA